MRPNRTPGGQPELLEGIDPASDELMRALFDRGGKPLPTLPPMRKSSAELLIEIRAARARARQRLERRARVRRPIFATIIAFVALLLPGAIAPSVAAAAAMPNPIALEFQQDAPPAGPWLQQLLSQLAQSSPGVNANQAFIHTQQWHLKPDTIDPTQIYALDVKTWWSLGAIRRETIHLPPQEPRREVIAYTEAAARQWQHSKPDIQGYSQSNYPALLPYPFADASELARQIGSYQPPPHELPASKSQRVLRAAAHLAANYVLGPAERRALLTVLAETEGLVYRGKVTDRAGQTGIAISTEAEHNGTLTRDVLVINERDGSLLSHETVVLSADKPLMPLPAVTAYTLYLGGLTR
jgi:hypothetical protein